VDLTSQSAVELLAELRTGGVSARELLDAHVERHLAVHERINAVVDHDLDRAYRVAGAIDDARTAGARLGPLAGLPMTVKDCFDVDGMPAVVGNPDWVGRPLECTEADVVRRARVAGAVIWGKTNVSRMLGDWQSHNDVYGTTNNPHDPAFTAGGSSGGSAAAVASGISPLEIGSDIGGSLRVPANFCGVYALKPTWGLVPQGGHIPPAPGVREDPPRDLNVVGPIARTPEDLRTLYGVLADRPVRPRRSVRGRRIGVWLDQTPFHVGGESRAAVERAAAVLEAQGADVRPAELDIPPRELVDSYIHVLMAVVSEAPPTDSETVATARHRRVAHRAAARRFFDGGWDAILAPVMAIPAFRHDHERPREHRFADVDGKPIPYLELIEWIALATFLHLPAIACPAGMTREGMPAGVQIVGAWNGEDGLFDLAGALDEAYGFQDPRGGKETR
jgi:amidase